MSSSEGIAIQLDKYGVSATLRALAQAYRNPKTMDSDKVSIVPVAAALMKVSAALAQDILSGAEPFVYVDQYHIRLEGVDTLSNCLHVSIEEGGDWPANPGVKQWSGFITIASFRRLLEKVDLEEYD